MAEFEDRKEERIEYKEEKMDSFYSALLERKVEVNILLPTPLSNTIYPLLLLNDGQDMEALKIKSTLEEVVNDNSIPPIIVAGVVAADRLQEYGVAGKKDYLKRGSRAGVYTNYVLTELLPQLKANYPLNEEPSNRVIAGCSMGGLSAFDIAWNNPNLFGKVGAFSGSFWWRKRNSRSLFYSDHHDRIIHLEVRQGMKKENLKFWLQTGTQDEAGDRNNNGVIDSIDDTMDLITELTKKGYRPFQDIQYHEVKDGKHNLETWAEAMPEFLKWAFKM